MNITNIIPVRAEIVLLNLAASASLLRPTTAKLLEWIAYRHLIEGNDGRFPEQVQYDKLAILKAMIHSSEKGLSRGFIGPSVRNKLAEVFLAKIIYKPEETRQQFSEGYGMYPPGFVLISPTARCNLKCKGCYAGSDASRKARLP